jgi:S-adenosylmethionine hydrolase
VALPGAGRTGGTFDGRDLFAPVAARLWSGATLNDVGLPIDPGSLVHLPPPLMRVSPAGSGPTPGSVEAEVLWVDRFGNVQLAAGAAEMGRAGLGGDVEIRVGAATRRARSVTSFVALDDDDVGLMIDANGRLSLVCRLRPAATVLGVHGGDVVTISQIPGETPGPDGPDRRGGRGGR